MGQGGLNISPAALKVKRLESRARRGFPAYGVACLGPHPVEFKALDRSLPALAARPLEAHGVRV